MHGSGKLRERGYASVHNDGKIQLDPTIADATINAFIRSDHYLRTVGVDRIDEGGLQACLAYSPRCSAIV